MRTSMRSTRCQTRVACADSLGAEAHRVQLQHGDQREQPLGIRTAPYPSGNNLHQELLCHSLALPSKESLLPYLLERSPATSRWITTELSYVTARSATASSNRRAHS